jgi:hypothetical protein
VKQFTSVGPDHASSEALPTSLTLSGSSHKGLT